MPNFFSRRALLRVVLAGLVAVALRVSLSPAAASPDAASPAAASPAAASDAAAPIVALNGALAEIMKAGKATPFVARYQTLAPVVEQSFDLTAVLRLVVGRHWVDMPPAVQSALLAEFNRFTVASFVANFDDGSGERLEILPATRVVGGDTVIETRIVFAKDDPVRIDYVMRESEGRWRVVDVLLDGTISRVAVQCSDFRRILETGGPLALIATLRKKVAALSGGALT
jgi:phospholipid transport system substrate-binding protein